MVGTLMVLQTKLKIYSNKPYFIFW